MNQKSNAWIKPMPPGQARLSEGLRLSFPEQAFALVSEHLGRRVLKLDKQGLDRLIARNFPEASAILSDMPLPIASGPLLTGLSPEYLASVPLSIISASWAVAENGAIALPASMGRQVLPFLHQKVALLLERKKIFRGMAQAVSEMGEQPEGVFLAGLDAELPPLWQPAYHRAQCLSIILL